jgi:ribulose 1,5-bisphosphate synthetase/thiazole synthase
VGSAGAGLTAAYFFYKAKEKAGQKCLILENHPIFGGEAKQNGVSGQRPTAHRPARCLAHGLSATLCSMIFTANPTPGSEPEETI